MHKRIAATRVVAALGGAPTADAAVPDLERTPATELAAKLAAGELTSVELTKAYIDRIAAVNQRGPSIHAVRSHNPDALREARVSDLARRTGSVRGPLEGLLAVDGVLQSAGAVLLGGAHRYDCIADCRTRGDRASRARCAPSRRTSART